MEELNSVGENWSAPAGGYKPYSNPRQESFEDVKRWYHAKEEVIEHQQGNWITFKEYEKLLNAYKELKFRMEGLEK
jgi:hypothetical protein